MTENRTFEDFKLVVSTDGDADWFTKVINDMLDNGWELYGSQYVSDDDPAKIYQAMAKY